jgi:hypothetical protein
MKLIISLVLISAIFSMIFDHKADFETINRIAKDMNIYDKEEITKDEFSHFFMRVVTKDKQVDNSNFYRAVFKKYMEDIPKKVRTDDLITYVDFDKLKDIMIDIVREQYGEQHARAVKEKLKEYETEREREEAMKENREKSDL